MRILLTGASGFTGRHFLDGAKALGHTCIALSQSGRPIEGIETLHADLKDKESLTHALEGKYFDAVVHLAAISFVAHGDIQEIYETNLLGTINLIDVLAALPAPPKRYLVASSGNIYGNTDILPINEESKYNPANDYAASKCAMELALTPRSASLDITIVRPFNYTGVGQAEHFLVPKIVSAFKRKDASIQLGNLDVSRDFSDVRDVVEAYLRLLETEESATYNVCSGKAISLFDVIRTCEKITGHKMKVNVNPAFVRENEVKILYGAPDKLENVIGFYRRFDIENTLEWMLNS